MKLNVVIEATLVRLKGVSRINQEHCAYLDPIGPINAGDVAKLSRGTATKRLGNQTVSVTLIRERLAVHTDGRLRGVFARMLTQRRPIDDTIPVAYVAQIAQPLASPRRSPHKSSHSSPSRPLSMLKPAPAPQGPARFRFPLAPALLQITDYAERAVVDFHSEMINSESIAWVKNFEPSFGSSPLSLPHATDFRFLLQTRCVDYIYSKSTTLPFSSMALGLSCQMVEYQGMGEWHWAEGGKYGHDLARG
ncbi:hypothetical protein B0H14DRAFT_2625003 [Mycena olivaceomarginata]|nr:hypothetical protein B0H14DRAFT_2625003 [Mycena olivaceomarginata]